MTPIPAIACFFVFVALLKPAYILFRLAWRCVALYRDGRRVRRDIASMFAGSSTAATPCRMWNIALACDMVSEVIDQRNDVFSWRRPLDKESLRVVAAKSRQLARLAEENPELAMERWVELQRYAHENLREVGF